MPPPCAPPGPLVWVTDTQSREFLVQLLTANGHVPRVVGSPGEALQALKGQGQATVFVDCRTVSTHGPGLYAKIKVACPLCRVVLLCDKTHQEHRDLIKEAMDLGIYACLLAPPADWEVLAMMRRSLVPQPPGRRPPRTREKN